MMLEGLEDFPRAERELFQWRIRIESEVELDVELKQVAKEEADHLRFFDSQWSNWFIYLFIEKCVFFMDFVDLAGLLKKLLEKIVIYFVK